jgi:hypothetical protein
MLLSLLGGGREGKEEGATPISFLSRLLSHSWCSRHLGRVMTASLRIASEAVLVLAFDTFFALLALLIPVGFKHR